MRSYTMPNKPKFIYSSMKLAALFLKVEAISLQQTLPLRSLGTKGNYGEFFRLRETKFQRKWWELRNRLLEKYPIELRIDPLKEAQLSVQAESKEKADQIIKNFTTNINKALYKKYGVSELTCGYLPE